MPAPSRRHARAQADIHHLGDELDRGQPWGSGADYKRKAKLDKLRNHAVFHCELRGCIVEQIENDSPLCPGAREYKVVLDDDRLPIEEVGPWAKEKHQRLRRYIDISRATRRKWVQGQGGATYVDLYCGAGRAVIRDTGEKIDGSPLVAFKCARDTGVPFSQIHIADASEESCRAAELRLISVGGSAVTDVGPAEETARRIVKRLNPYGLHFAFLDPYNLQDLPFSVIQAFSSLKYVDILIHVSAQDLQRNLDSYSRTGDGPLDTFAPGWRAAVGNRRPPLGQRSSHIGLQRSKYSAFLLLDEPNSFRG